MHVPRIALLLIFLMLLTDCGNSSRRSDTTLELQPVVSRRPWPEPLWDTWGGTCLSRRFVIDSLVEESIAHVTLSLDKNTFEYRDSSAVLGKGTYVVDGAYLAFSYLLMDRIEHTPFDLTGRFEFVYEDSLIILMQREAIGPAVRDQVFVEKELVLRRAVE